MALLDLFCAELIMCKQADLQTMYRRQYLNKYLPEVKHLPHPEADEIEYLAKGLKGEAAFLYRLKRQWIPLITCTRRIDCFVLQHAKIYNTICVLDRSNTLSIIVQGFKPSKEK